MKGRARFAVTVLAFGYAFLYLPIALFQRQQARSLEKP